MRAVLITGTSTGIGRAAAQAMAARGYKVFAGVRGLGDAPEGTVPILLDVSQPSHVEEAIQRLEPEDLAAVINNAGFNYVSAFEYSEEKDLRELMEVNFFGLSRISRAFIPHLRKFAKRHPGETAKLVQVCSIGGLIGVPWEVFYHASKFAVVGLRRLERLIGTASALGSSPEAVADVVSKILGQRNPKFRHLVGMDARILFALSRVLPQRAFGMMMRAQFAPLG